MAFPGTPVGTPWAYSSPEAYGGIFSQLLGQLNPQLGGLASSFKLDDLVGQLLVAKGLLPAGAITKQVSGLFGQATPAINPFINVASRQLYEGGISPAFKAMNNESQRLLLTRLYEATDPTNVEARVNAAMNNPLNPASIGAFFAASRFGLKELQSGTARAAMAGGVQALPFSGMDFAGQQLGSEAERRLAFGTADMSVVRRRSEIGARLYGQLGATLGKQLIESPGEFGGMRGEALGQLITRLSGTGGLGAEMNRLQRELERTGTDIKPELIQASVDKLTGRIKAVARTVTSMKDVFGGTDTQVMEQMSAVMGVDAPVTLAANPQMRLRMLEMRHLAKMTGTSAESLGGLGAAAQQYIQAMGGNLGGATNAVNATMAIMGSGAINMAGLNTQQFQGQVLRNVVGSQQGQFSRLTAAAYQFWRNRPENANYTEADAIARFQLQLRESGDLNTPSSLAKVAGVGVSDLATVATNQETTRLLNETKLGNQTFEEQNTLYGNIIRRGLGFAGLANLQITDFTEQGLEDALNKAKLTGNDRLIAKSKAQQVMDTASQLVYGMDQRSAEQFRAGQQESLRVQQIASERAVMEERMGRAGISTEGGLAGLIRTVQSQRKVAGETPITIGEALGGLLGMTRLEEVVPGQLQQAMGGLGEAERGRLDEAFQAVVRGTDYRGEALGAEATKAFADVLQSQTPEEMRTALDKVSRYTNERAGREAYLRDTMKDTQAADAYAQAATSEEQKMILQESLLKGAAAQMAVPLDAEKMKTILEDKQITPEELSQLGLSEQKTKELQEAYKGRLSDVGLPVSNLSMETVLSQLVEVLKQLANK